MAGVDGLGLGGRRQLDRELGEGLVVALPDLGATLEAGLHPGELMEAEGGLDVGHVVLEAGHRRGVVAVPRVGEASPGVVAQAVEGVALDRLRERRARGGHHPALAGGHVLGDVEAERSHVPDDPDAPAPVLRSDRVGRVLDHHQVVSSRDVHDRVHVARTPVEMHRDDGPRAGRDGGLDALGIDEAGAAVAVGEHRYGSRMDDRVRGCHEGHRGGDHLRARADPGRDQAEVERGGAGADRDRVLGAGMGAKELLEAGDLGPGSEPPRAQGVDDLGDLGLSDQGSPEDEEPLSHLTAFHPFSGDPGRRAHHLDVIRHVPGDERARGDHGSAPDGQRVEDDGAQPDVGAVADRDATRDVRPGRDRHPVPYRGVVADQATSIDDDVPADRGVGGHHDAGAHDGARADGAGR